MTGVSSLIVSPEDDVAATAHLRGGVGSELKEFPTSPDGRQLPEVEDELRVVAGRESLVAVRPGLQQLERFRPARIR